MGEGTWSRRSRRELAATLEEEKAADEKLTDAAESRVNEAAAAA
jgi:ferritin-like metal-binding protein YciE